MTPFARKQKIYDSFTFAHVLYDILRGKQGYGVGPPRYALGAAGGTGSIAGATQKERGCEYVKNVYISLPSATQVQAFAETLTKLEGDFDLVSGRYILDARSMMGIFSLDLEHPIELKIHQDTPETLQALQAFTVEGPKA